VSSLNQQELQNLRHLIGCHDTDARKLNFYAQQCNDPQIRQMFEQSAQSAQSTMQKLMIFLD